jgi:hypothetical protein
MTQFKYTPWTRFPIPDEHGRFTGRFLNESFQAWWNPTAHTGPAEVDRQIDLFMKQQNVDGKLVWLPNCADKMKRNYKWEKFWLAVHVLHEWVHWKAGVDDELLKKCMHLYFDDVATLSDGPQTKYHDAAIFEPESQKHKTVYAEFTNLNLTPPEKERLMNFLLEQKRNAVLLFGKVRFLDTRRIKLPQSKGERVQKTLRQLSPQEYLAANQLSPQQYQAANGVACTFESLTQSALANPIDIRLAQDEQQDVSAAAQALLGLSGSGAGQACDAAACGGLHEVRMLLDCLQRLAVDGDECTTLHPKSI